MFKVTCDYCNEDIFFPDTASKPAICENCNSSLDGLQVQSVEPVQEYEDTREQETTIDITLTYQKTNEKITIQLSDDTGKIILGRENFGQEILHKIPQISRSHCCLEFKNHQCIITDLGSLNGTYVGVARTDCKESQVLQDGDLLFLGREPFIVNLSCQSSKQPEESQAVPEQQPSMETDEIMDDTLEKEQRYRCRSCGAEFDEHADICPDCGTFDAMERV